MPRVYTQTARKDYPAQGITKGQTYYKWQFFRSRYVHRSATFPKPWQLTQSPFKQQLYQLQETNWEDEKDLEALKNRAEEVRDEFSQLRDEAEESLYNMPDHLQDTSDSGMLLTERMDGLEEVVNALETVISDIEDFDPEADIEQMDFEPGEDEDELELMSEARQELIDEKMSEFIDALNDAINQYSE